MASAGRRAVYEQGAGRVKRLAKKVSDELSDAPFPKDRIHPSDSADGGRKQASRRMRGLDEGRQNTARRGIRIVGYKGKSCQLERLCQLLPCVRVRIE